MRVVLDGTRVHEGARAVEEAEPPDVERPEVEAGAAFQNPLGPDGARPAAGGDAVEEAAGAGAVAQLRRLAPDDVAVGRLDRKGDVRGKRWAGAGVIRGRRHQKKKKRNQE